MGAATHCTLLYMKSVKHVIVLYLYSIFAAIIAAIYAPSHAPGKSAGHDVPGSGTGRSPRSNYLHYFCCIKRQRSACVAATAELRSVGFAEVYGARQLRVA
jgi:hypothetical protein